MRWIQVIGPTATPVPLPDWVRPVRLGATSDHPRGAYGQAIGDHATADGLVVVEQDIALDPIAVRELMQAIARWPRWVIAVPYVLWPTSTGRDGPIWAHRIADAQGHWQPVPTTQRCPAPPARGCGISSGRIGSGIRSPQPCSIMGPI